MLLAEEDIFAQLQDIQNELYTMTIPLREAQIILLPAAAKVVMTAEMYRIPCHRHTLK